MLPAVSFGSLYANVSAPNAQSPRRPAAGPAAGPAVAEVMGTGTARLVKQAILAYDLAELKKWVGKGLSLHGQLSEGRKGYSGHSALHVATSGCVEVFEYLLQLGLDVNARGASGKTPLHCAVSQKRPEFVNMLLAEGADPNIVDADGISPLHQAAKGGQCMLVRLLLIHGADHQLKTPLGKVALHLAVQSKDAKTIRVLEHRQAIAIPVDLDKEGQCAFLATNLLQPERTCHKKSTGSDSIDPVSSDDPISSSSSSGGDDALISSWLVAEEDAVVDLVALATANKVALLISTLTSHRTKNVDLLVDGRTALFAACKYGHVECANVLVQHGADVNFQCAEGTPLSAALMSNNKECVQLLLAHSANPNFVDFFDCTPLHIACYNGLHEMVSLLLSVDSSLTLRDKNGMTPIDYCAKWPLCQKAIRAATSSSSSSSSLSLSSELTSASSPEVAADDKFTRMAKKAKSERNILLCHHETNKTRGVVTVPTSTIMFSDLRVTIRRNLSLLSSLGISPSRPFVFGVKTTDESSPSVIDYDSESLVPVLATSLVIIPQAVDEHPISFI